MGRRGPVLSIESLFGLRMKDLGVFARPLVMRALARIKVHGVEIGQCGLPASGFEHAL